VVRASSGVMEEGSRGGHSLIKFKTTCVQTLLPLCYMLRIIQNFINYFVEL
jgi:hypothetical protein